MRLRLRRVLSCRKQSGCKCRQHGQDHNCSCIQSHCRFPLPDLAWRLRRGATLQPPCLSSVAPNWQQYARYRLPRFCQIIVGISEPLRKAKLGCLPSSHPLLHRGRGLDAVLASSWVCRRGVPKEPALSLSKGCPKKQRPRQNGGGAALTYVVAGCPVTGLPCAAWSSRRSSPCQL